MFANVTKEMAVGIGYEELKNWGLTEEMYRYSTKYVSIPLVRYGKKDIAKLRAIFEAVPASMKGQRTIVSDIKAWQRALDGESPKASNPKKFEPILHHFLGEHRDATLKAGRPEGVRLYQHKASKGVWVAYHVAKIYYVKAEHHRGGGNTPAHVDMRLAYREMGSNFDKTISFYLDDFRKKTVQEALAGKGFTLETQERFDSYSRTTEIHDEWVDQIGKQFHAVGMGTDNLDGNPGKDRESRFYWGHRSHRLDVNGEPGRVVVDLYQEKEGRDNHRAEKASEIDRLYWVRKSETQDPDAYGSAPDEEEGLDGEIVDYEDIPGPLIPLHPTLAVFDMVRHLRLRVDVGQLTPYPYDVRLGDKLVLPSDSRNLVEMLLAHRGQFNDIVKGKSGGVIILCAGIPGTGKTLTSEVYAEVMGRPLYTVQAAQLGTTPDDLEEELMKVFNRATRWGAILLLDEADVYVHKRGNDLIQNAIVGVFLRVLEYYRGVLFMTTNRSDLVDDAIASRCVARIDYVAPDEKDQKEIWKILSRTSGIKIKDRVIDEVVKRFPDLTGRDVKNLLKLSQMVASSRESEITLDIIRFAKRFKPTVGTESEKADDEIISLPPLPTISHEGATEGHQPNQEDAGPGGWKNTVRKLFSDGSPHSVAEAKELLTEHHPDVHPNAITNAIRQMVKNRFLERMDSGLYRFIEKS